MPVYTLHNKSVMTLLTIPCAVHCILVIYYFIMQMCASQLPFCPLPFHASFWKPSVCSLYSCRLWTFGGSINLITLSACLSDWVIYSIFLCWADFVNFFLKIIYLMENFRFTNMIWKVFFFCGSFGFSNFVYFYSIFLDSNSLNFCFIIFLFVLLSFLLLSFIILKHC